MNLSRLLFACLIIFATASCSIGLSGCGGNIVPDYQLEIDSTFEVFFRRTFEHDTLCFKSSQNEVRTFVTKQDSIVENKKSIFLEQPPYRMIQGYFHEIVDGKIVEKSEVNSLFVNKDGVDGKNSIGITFEGLYFFRVDSLPPVHSDTLFFNLVPISDYLILINQRPPGIRNDVISVLFNHYGGIIGFTERSGKTWTSDKLCL